jgi:glycosidase
MKYWISETDIDGFRCDVAGWVPIDFWVEARKELESVKPVFMLAEAEGSQMYEAFDMTYGWEFHHIMNQIFQGDKGIEDMYTYFNKESENVSQLQMHFTSNHDENSWNGTVMERLGDSRFAFAVLAATIEGMPLIYNGQETSLDKRLRFFDKDTINWAKMDLVEFYTKIFALKEMIQVNGGLSL